MRRFSKALLFVLALVPVAWLTWGLFQGRLGANPAETIQLQTGRWALEFLLITLSITPLRRLTGWNVAIQYPAHARTLRVFLRVPALHVLSS